MPVLRPLAVHAPAGAAAADAASGRAGHARTGRTATDNAAANDTGTSTVDFAGAARALTRAARRMGLVGPSYRCPPRLVGVDRTIRRRPDGAIVAVRLRGRPFAAVLADMIEGVVVTNGLQPPVADRVRADLWRECGVVTEPSLRPAVDNTRRIPRVA